MRTTIDKYLGYFLAALLALMTLDVLWGVFTRYALGGQASWSEELARFLLIWIGILGAAYASGQRMHLAIELLLPKLEPRRQRRLLSFINLLILGFAFAVLVVGGLRLMYITHTLEQLSPAMQLPMAGVYAVLPLSGLLVMYYKAADFIQLQKA
ncbi:MAG: TRAP transporter small permease [Saprospiraceae bacterium]